MPKEECLAPTMKEEGACGLQPSLSRSNLAEAGNRSFEESLQSPKITGRNGDSPHAAIDAIFYTVSNAHYFAGTVATLSSIRTFHPGNEIWVFCETRELLGELQLAHLRSLPKVHCVTADQFQVGTIREAWQLKAHAAHFLAQRHEGVLVQVDSDAVLCSSLDDIIDEAHSRGVPAGGKDGAGMRYDRAKYAPYHALCGLASKQNDDFNPHYTSTSILILPLPAVRDIVALWSRAVDEATWGPETQERKIYGGHGDQGVLNAILHFKGIIPLTLPNELISEHWTHGQSRIRFREGKFWNGEKAQMAFHSVSDAPKFWESAYLSYVEKNPALREVYLYWLYQLFDGPCGVLRGASWEKFLRDRTALFPTISHDLCAVYFRRRDQDDRTRQECARVDGTKLPEPKE